jgi:hypothetical protein
MMRIVRAARCRPGVTAILLVAVVAVSIGFAAAVGAEPTRPRVGEGPTQFTIQSRPIASFDNRDATRMRFGKLEFRGGMELRSDYREFGGISGLLLDADNQHVLGLSDRGRWFRGRITYDSKKPTGIADAEMAPMLAGDGTPLARKGWFDTESLTRDGRSVYVGIERVDRIVKFDYGGHGFAARGRAIATPADFKGFPYNKSLECLVAMPRGGPHGGALITVLEKALDAAGNLRGFILGGKQPGEFSVVRSDDFDVSDCALMPNGDLLLLERRFSILRGVAMRIRRIPIAAIKPGATIDGEQLVFADMAYQVDNMEGLSVNQTADGETVLTLISDDNFSSIQRTILLQFTLVPE